MRNEAQSLQNDELPESGPRAKSVEDLNKMLAEDEAARAADRLEGQKETAESSENTGGDRFMADVQKYNELDNKVKDMNVNLKKLADGIPPSANLKEAQASMKADITNLEARRDGVMNAYGTDAVIFKTDVERLNGLRAKIDERKKQVRDFERRTDISRNDTKQKIHGEMFDRMAMDIVNLEREYDAYSGKMKADYDSRDADSRAVSHENLSTTEIDAALSKLDDVMEEDKAAEDAEYTDVSEEMLAAGGTEKAVEPTLEPVVEFKSKMGESKIENLSGKLEPIANELAAKFGISDPEAALAERAKKGKLSRFFGGLFNRKEFSDQYDKLSNEIADLQAEANMEANRTSSDPAVRARYEQSMAMRGRGGSRLGSGEGRNVERK